MTRSLSLSFLVCASLGIGCTVSRVPTTDAGAEPVDAPIMLPDVPIVIDVGPPPPTCDPGEIDCFGTCTRVAADSLNCGSCGNACPSGVTCAVGRCDCREPMVACDGLCLDPMNDAEHCGTCDVACDPTQMCSMGECIVSCTEADHRVCVNTDSSGVRTQVCADLLNDPMNCGGCNTRCSGGATCQAGVCACPTGMTSCSGVCTDTRTDASNCGFCLTSCGEGGVCTAGACSTCGGSLTACGTPARCVDTATSRLHCGMCGRPCGGGESCVGGLCQCVSGLIDCGAGCLDPMTNVANCGGCGNDCGAGGVCSGGTCTCASGLTMCGTSCHDTSSDLAHCGGCDMPCPPLTGGVCLGGFCGCPPPTIDCGGTCVDTNTDRDNCSACGMACPAGFICRMGACTDAPPIRYMQTTPSPGTVTFVDACAATPHTELLPNTDDSSALVPLPFPFRYWATDLAAGAMVNVGTNGYINLDGAMLTALSGTVPAVSTPNAVIAALWGDNVTRSPGICVATVGTMPTRRFVVEWPMARYFGGTENVTFEIILSEGTGTIDLVYGTMTATGTRTVGIENQTGMMGINACPGGTGGCLPATGTVIRFVPIP